jgi:hypothetical protein
MRQFLGSGTKNGAWYGPVRKNTEHKLPCGHHGYLPSGLITVVLVCDLCWSSDALLGTYPFLALSTGS